MSVAAEKLADFDGGYGRSGVIRFVTGKCSVCGAGPLPVIEIDASEAEYNAGRICRECAERAFGVQQLLAGARPAGVGPQTRVDAVLEGLLDDLVIDAMCWGAERGSAKDKQEVEQSLAAIRNHVATTRAA
jgi:hypothetical protein